MSSYFLHLVERCFAFKSARFSRNAPKRLCACSRMHCDDSVFWGCDPKRRLSGPIRRTDLKVVKHFKLCKFRKNKLCRLQSVVPSPCNWRVCMSKCRIQGVFVRWAVCRRRIKKGQGDKVPFVNRLVAIANLVQLTRPERSLKSFPSPSSTKKFTSHGNCAWIFRRFCLVEGCSRPSPHCTCQVDIIFLFHNSAVPVAGIPLRTSWLYGWVDPPPAEGPSPFIPLSGSKWLPPPSSRIGSQPWRFDSGIQRFYIEIEESQEPPKLTCVFCRGIASTHPAPRIAWAWPNSANFRN